MAEEIPEQLLKIKSISHMQCRKHLNFEHLMDRIVGD